MNKKYEKIKGNYLAHLKKALRKYPCITKQQVAEEAKALAHYTLVLMDRLAKRPLPPKNHRLSVVRDHCIQHFDSEQKSDNFLQALSHDPTLAGQAVYIPKEKNLLKMFVPVWDENP